MVGTSNPNTRKTSQQLLKQAVRAAMSEPKIIELVDEPDDQGHNDLIRPVASLNLVKKQAILLRDILEDEMMAMKQVEDEYKTDEQYEIELGELAELIKELDKTWPWLC